MLDVRIYSRYGKRATFKAKEVLFNGVNGETGILPAHTLYAGTVDYGIITIKDERDEVKKLLTDEGFISVENDTVSFFLINVEDVDTADDDVRAQISLIEEKKEGMEDDDRNRLKFLKNLLQLKIKT